MKADLWYVFGSSRGGPNRLRLVYALEHRPRNANQLAKALDLDYTTVRHHLDVLMQHGVVSKTDDEYGAVYEPSESAREHWGTIEEIEIQQREAETAENTV
ncbi:winged helix-turn-helix domain-containing protein [Natranaeroarchaeum sulfidigenes]|uniref:Transcriptional regulator containing HTH domain,ArsR family n=1 Tax=Natranaeroarchaeum sulfidigenes TaxID=2784880 RepID=A0A897MTN0_9EURY|nr:winged helix-turn-helix domain-containing protein [Natranaeroarchaeum sulfidigenes]QSG03651.1 Transcriptional regulator containing HTH domain,ArsR family [Natranaeroarchaeum sulfidigenes]